MNLKIIALALAVAGIAPNAAFAQSVSGAGAPGTPTTIIDGGDFAEGATSGTSCGSDIGTGCTLLQRLSRIATNLTTLNTTAGTPPNNLASAGGDPCFASTKINVAINSAVANTQLVAPVSAKKVYICSLLVIAGGTASVSIAEGTGALCNTAAQAGIIGVAANGTLSAGVPLVVNAGWQMGSGSGTVAMTNTAANGVCIVQSATVQLSGNLTYVQQ